MENDWDEYNVVLLGETGAGKSTFINALANYFAFDSFEEAKNYEPIVLISSVFTEQVNGDGARQFTARCTLDRERHADKENHKTGESATQVPHSYVFPFPKKKMFLRIVDTPGIGDTRGFEQDASNMREIVRYLSLFKEIHAIVVLMKSNEARLTPSVQFCLDELLVHLPRGAQENLFFGFTNCAAHSFTPGESYRIVEAYLKHRGEQSGVEIPFSGESCYCFDNMAFRAHCAYLADQELFEEMYDEGEDVERCFGESRDQAKKALKYFIRLHPIPTSEIAELKELRSTLRALCVPRAALREKENNNANAKVVLSERIAENQKELEECRTKLMVEQEVWEKQPLPNRQLVCSSKTCLEEQKTADGHSEKIFRICENPCSCFTASALAAVNLAEVQKCQLIENGKCAVCDCSWRTHMQVDFKMVKVRKQVEDSVVKQRIEDLERQINDDISQGNLNDKEDAEVDGELNTIRETCLALAARIKNISIIHKNEGFVDIVDHAINEEKGLGKDSKKLEVLQKMKAEHEEEILLFTESETAKVAACGPSEIAIAIDEIRALKHSGQLFKDETDKQPMDYNTLEIDVPLTEKRAEVEADRRQRENIEEQTKREEEMVEERRRVEEKRKELEVRRAIAKKRHAETVALLKQQIQLMMEDSSSESSSSESEESSDEEDDGASSVAESRRSGTTGTSGNTRTENSANDAMMKMFEQFMQSMNNRPQQNGRRDYDDRRDDWEWRRNQEYEPRPRYYEQDYRRENGSRMNGSERDPRETPASWDMQRR